MRTQLQFVAASLLVSVPMLAAPAQETKREVRTRVVLNDPAGARVLNGAERASWLMSGRRTFLGVQLMSMTPELRTHMGAPSGAGMLVAAVSEDSPASRAGIRVGDVITQIGAKRIENLAHVFESLGEARDGERTTVAVIRNGAPMQLSAQIEERDRRAVAVNRLPEGARIFRDGADGGPAELRRFFAGPEWKERLLKLEDCRDSQQKLRELETRLKELEKRLR